MAVPTVGTGVIFTATECAASTVNDVLENRDHPLPFLATSFLVFQFSRKFSWQKKGGPVATFDHAVLSRSLLIGLRLLITI